MLPKLINNYSKYELPLVFAKFFARTKVDTTYRTDANTLKINNSLLCLKSVAQAWISASQMNANKMKKTKNHEQQNKVIGRVSTLNNVAYRHKYMIFNVGTFHFTATNATVFSEQTF